MIFAFRRISSGNRVPNGLVKEGESNVTAQNADRWLKSVGCHRVLVSLRNIQSNVIAGNLMDTVESATKPTNSRTWMDLIQGLTFSECNTANQYTGNDNN